MTVEEQFEKLKVGDILTCRWGYSMVLWDFYKVLKKTKKTVTIQELKTSEEPSDVYLQVKVKPIENSFANKPAMIRRVGKNGWIHADADCQRIHISDIYDPEYPYIEDHAD